MREARVVATAQAPADAAWPTGRAWSRARRWAGPGAAAVVAATAAAVEGHDWDPERSAVAVARSFPAADAVRAELAELAATNPGVAPEDLTALLFEEVSDFAYLRGLPSLLGQHVARALGGAASSCAVLADGEEGLVAAEATARRMIGAGEVDAVLVAGVLPDGRGEARLLTAHQPAAAGAAEECPLILAGSGAVTALGPSFETTWDGLLAGRSGIGRVDWANGVPTAHAAAEVPREARAELVTRWSRRLGRDATWVDALAHEVADQALAGLPPTRLGVVHAPMWPGPGGSSPETFAAWFAGLPDGTAQDASEHPFATNLARLTGHDVVALELEATCAGGLRALAEAARLVASGEVEAALALGVVARDNPYVVSQFAQLTALSRYPGDPEEASRPFDAARAGMVMAEGAAAVLVRRAEPGEAGIHLLGTGLALGVEHPTAPAPAAIGTAVTRALRSAGVASGEIGTVNAHGTGTRLNDEAEAQALRELLGERAASTPVAACKSMTGHASSASGLLEVAALARSLATGTVPGVPTCTEPDPALGLDVSPRTRAASARTGLTTSFGFGGQYAAAVLQAR